VTKRRSGLWRLGEYLGIARRQKPLRERLMPWPTYALLAVVSVVCGLYLTSGPEGLHNTGVISAIFFLTVPCLLYLAALAYRVRR
jgi:hypothetical protein